MSVRQLPLNDWLFYYSIFSVLASRARDNKLAKQNTKNHSSIVRSAVFCSVGYVSWRLFNWESFLVYYFRVSRVSLFAYCVSFARWSNSHRSEKRQIGTERVRSPFHSPVCHLIILFWNSRMSRKTHEIIFIFCAKNILRSSSKTKIKISANYELKPRTFSLYLNVTQRYLSPNRKTTHKRDQRVRIEMEQSTNRERREKWTNEKDEKQRKKSLSIRA